jgi:TonB dependent receptor
VNNYFSQPVKSDNDGEYDGRIDQNLGSHDQAFGRVSYNSEPVYLPTPLPGLAVGTASFNVGDQTTKAVSVALSETHTFSPTMLNELRAGYKRIHTVRLQPFYNDATDISGQYGVPGIPYLPPIGGGLTEFNISGLTLLGAHNSLPSDEVNAQFQLMDNVSKQLGSHALRFGFEYDRMKVAVVQPGYAKGVFLYSGQYTSVPNGNAASTGIAQMVVLPGPSTVVSTANVGGSNEVEASNLHQEDYRRPAYSAYLQDDWRITPKLTVNLGVRWEYFPMPTDFFGNLANFVPGTPGSTAQYLMDDRSKSIPLSASFLANLATDGISLVYSGNHALTNITPFNFAPRLGVAYQFLPKMVVRAAYGIFYDGIFNDGDGDNLGNNYPFEYTLAYTPSNSSGPITGNNSIGLTSNGLTNVPLSPANVNANGLTLVAQQKNWKLPYVQSINFTLQYLLSSNQSVTASFVNTAGRRLNVEASSNKPNQLLPPSASITQYIPFPQFAVGPPYELPEGNSNYYAAQGSYEFRLRGGLTALANYVWSQARTDATDTLFLNGVSYRAPSLPGFGIHGDYGYAPFDVRNAIHIASTYQLPFGHGRAFLSEGRLVNAVLGGWALSEIFTLQSGNPVTITCSVTTGASSGCNALRAPGVGLYAGAHTVQHWANAAAFENPPVVTSVGEAGFAPLGGPSQQIVGPRFHRGDISVGKRWQTSERTALEFRGDIFNITNTPNFSPPGTLNFGTAATFASITSTRDSPEDPREIQLGLNFYFGQSGGRK